MCLCWPVLADTLGYAISGQCEESSVQWLCMQMAQQIPNQGICPCWPIPLQSPGPARKTEGPSNSFVFLGPLPACGEARLLKLQGNEIGPDAVPNSFLLQVEQRRLLQILDRGKNN